jgi:hypothetical protein
VTEGWYPINVAQGTLAVSPGASAGNYTFALVNGTITVGGGSSQTITFPALPATITYGDRPIALCRDLRRRPSGDVYRDRIGSSHGFGSKRMDALDPQCRTGNRHGGPDGQRAILRRHAADPRFIESPIVARHSEQLSSCRAGLPITSAMSVYGIHPRWLLLTGESLRYSSSVIKTMPHTAHPPFDFYLLKLRNGTFPEFSTDPYCLRSRTCPTKSWHLEDELSYRQLTIR